MSEPSIHTREIAILAYHKIGPPPADGWDTWNYVGEEVFIRHLDFLKNSEWQMVGLDDLLNGLQAPEMLAERSALITFDDGYLSNLTVAAPILHTYGFPAIIFVPTGFVGGYNAFDADIHVEPYERICDWDDLRKLQSYGFSVQSHGVWHTAFSKSTLEERIRELTESKTLLEKQLGRPVRMFSFPYGDSGADNESLSAVMQSCGYEAACKYGGGIAVLPKASRYRLDRVAIGPDTSLELVLDQGTNGSPQGSD